MTYKKNVLFVSVLGIGAIVAGLAIHNHIVNVRAAKLEHIVPPAPYFPTGAIWTQEVSNTPVDPQSSAIIAGFGDSRPACAVFSNWGIWTQEGSNSPVDPPVVRDNRRGADAGGWGRGKMQVD